jgi:hypothetical protein
MLHILYSVAGMDKAHTLAKEYAKDLLKGNRLLKSPFVQLRITL